MRYRTIVADPPWQLQAGPGWNSNEHSRPLEYPTMTLDEISDLPVSELAETDAHLYLWTVNRYLEPAFEIVREWGFKTSTVLTWCKSPCGLGLGGSYVQTTEHVLFARRGSLRSLRRVDTTWFAWKRPNWRQPRISGSGHSRKPEGFLDIVETVSPGPYLELFARRQRLGWDTWGNEALEHVSL